MNPDALGAELGGEIAARRFKRRLDGSHQVVVLDHAVRAIEAHREERAALLHQRLGETGHANEGMAGNVHGEEESFARTVGHAPMQILLRGEGNRVHGEIKAAPCLPDARKEGFHRPVQLNIERHKDGGVDLARQGFDVGPGLLVEIRDGKLGALPSERPSTPISNRLIIRDADNEALLAGQGPAGSSKHLSSRPRVRACAWFGSACAWSACRSLSQRRAAVPLGAATPAAMVGTDWSRSSMDFAIRWKSFDPAAA